MTTLHFVYSEEMFRALCDLNKVKIRLPPIDDTSHKKTKRSHQPGSKRKILLPQLSRINNALHEFPGHQKQVLSGRMHVDVNDDVFVVAGPATQSAVSHSSSKANARYPFMICEAVTRLRATMRRLQPLPRIEEERSGEGSGGSRPTSAGSSRAGTEHKSARERRVSLSPPPGSGEGSAMRLVSSQDRTHGTG